MPRYSRQTIDTLFQRGDGSKDNQVKGRAFEDLICYVVQRVPGVSMTARDSLNAFGSEEIDIAFWNDQKREGFWFLPCVLLAECKNWSSPVGSQEVSYFAQKLKHKYLDHGILVAANGITGNPEKRTAAHQQMTLALNDGVHIIVLTGDEIKNLIDSNALVLLFKKKLTELAVLG